MRGLVVIGVAAIVAGCSDSASGTGDTPDAAQPAHDASAPVDAGHDASAPDTSADAIADTGSDSQGEASAPSCGDPPARFTLLTGADDGLARDNTTGLVWMRESHGAGEPPQTQALATTYCTGRTMRLPTKDEATALATAYTPCAFGHWGTWTSTAAPADGYAWVVDYTGGASPQVADNFPSAVLCVRNSK